jgi:hypothetical protein
MSRDMKIEVFFIFTLQLNIPDDILSNINFLNLA